MFGRQFYHSIIRKHVIVFGSLFNNIRISRVDTDGTILQNQKVPVFYGPREKFLAKLEAYEKVNQSQSTKPPIALQMPRMSFEITNFVYDASRRLPKTVYNCRADGNGAKNYQYSPVPYNISFRLSIMVKHAEDGAKIVEQIIPYFGPNWTVTMILIPELDMRIDVPIVLNDINMTDTYEGVYEERRALIWQLDFVMKSQFFGPVTTSKPIKNIDINLYVPPIGQDVDDVDVSAIDPVMTFNTHPGLTANGEPTTSDADSIPWQQINANDDYGFIESINEYFGDGT